MTPEGGWAAYGMPRERLQYQVAMLKVQTYLREGQQLLAKKTLWNTPPECRNWEWGYYLGLLTPHCVVMGVGDTGADTASFDPRGDRIVEAGAESTVPVWDACSGKKLAELIGHGDIVQSAEFSTDGTRVVTGSSDGTARVWDASTGEQLFVLGGHNDAVAYAEFSPDCRYIVSRTRENAAYLWDAETGKEHSCIRPRGTGMKRVWFDIESQHLVTFGDMIRLWDLPSCKEIVWHAREFALVPDASFRADTKRGVVQDCAIGPGLRVWDVRTGAYKDVGMQPGYHFHKAILSTDGTLLLTLSSEGGVRLVSLTGLETGESLREIHETVECAAFCPKGTGLALGLATGEIVLWDISMDVEIGRVAAADDRVYRLKWSPRGNRLLAITAKQIVLWDLAKRPIHTVRRLHLSAPFSISKDWGYAVTSGAGPYADILEVATGECLASLNGHTKKILAIAVSPDSMRVLTVSLDNTARVWDRKTGQIIAVLLQPEIGRGLEDMMPLLGPVQLGVGDIELEKPHINTAIFCSDGKSILTGSSNGVIARWNAATGDILDVFEDFSFAPTLALAASPDGNLAGAGFFDGSALLWDMGKNKQFSAALEHGHDAIETVLFSPDGRLFVSLAGDGTLRSWDAMTGRSQATNSGEISFVKLLKFNPHDKDMLAVLREKSVVLWNARSGEIVHELMGHRGAVLDVAFSPDGTRIVTVSHDKTVRLWDTLTGGEMAVMRGHGSLVFHVAFTDDGLDILTASADGSVRIWHAAPWRLEQLPSLADQAESDDAEWAARLDLWFRGLDSDKAERW